MLLSQVCAPCASMMKCNKLEMEGPEQCSSVSRAWPARVVGKGYCVDKCKKDHRGHLLRALGSLTAGMLMN